MANIVTVAGRTVRPAEITRKGDSIVARFTLATNSYRGKKKSEESAPTYIDFVAFGKQAEFAEKFLDKKGASIVVSRGHLRSDSYKNKEGETVYTTNVVADEFEFASCDLNKVLLIGRLTKDPEIRWTKSGQPLAIAQGLCSCYPAVFKRDILAVPRKIFSLYHAVLNIDILRMPEGILGIEITVCEFRIFYILKRILSLQRNIIKCKLIGAHHEVLALGT